MPGPAFAVYTLMLVFFSTSCAGMCADCGLKVVGEGSGCTAMDRVFHIACFTCRVCSCRLQGKPFYAVDGEPHCQECYMVKTKKTTKLDCTKWAQFLNSFLHMGK